MLLSGGDPLTIGDDKLDWLLTRLRAIKHVEFLRIGTKIPVVLPQRITKDFVKMLKKHHPLWMSIHVTHPTELTDEVTESTAPRRGTTRSRCAAADSARSPHRSTWPKRCRAPGPSQLVNACSRSA